MSEYKCDGYIGESVSWRKICVWWMNGREVEGAAGVGKMHGI